MLVSFKGASHPVKVNGLFGPGKRDKKAVFVAVLGKKTAGKHKHFNFLTPREMGAFFVRFVSRNGYEKGQFGP